MQLVPEVLLDAWVLVEEHVVDGLGCVFVVLLVDVGLSIYVLFLFLEGVSLHSARGPVEYDPLIDGLGRHDIFHAPDDLEPVLVQLSR